ncbi:MAG TPA: hypothetical protein VK092_07660 [Deinococcales bacterium]|nr:hypothetical protein [Deinococcales bacterium]
MKRISLILSAFLFLGAAALAHQSLDVGDGAYRLSAGFQSEPAYTGVMNGLELLVSDADGNPVENLESSLTAVVLGPEDAELVLELNAVYGEPGTYSGSFIPTAVGDYTFRVSGFIGAVEFDEHFDDPGHYEPVVRDASEVSIP